MQVGIYVGVDGSVNVFLLFKFQPTCWCACVSISKYHCVTKTISYYYVHQPKISFHHKNAHVYVCINVFTILRTRISNLSNHKYTKQMSQNILIGSDKKYQFFSRKLSVFGSFLFSIDQLSVFRVVKKGKALLDSKTVIITDIY